MGFKIVPQSDHPFPQIGAVLKINLFSTEMMICCPESCQKTACRHHGPFPRKRAKRAFFESGPCAGRFTHQERASAGHKIRWAAYVLVCVLKSSVTLLYSHTSYSRRGKSIKRGGRLGILCITIERRENKKKVIFCENGPRGSTDLVFISRLDFICKLIAELLNQSAHHSLDKSTKT